MKFLENQNKKINSINKIHENENILNSDDDIFNNNEDNTDKESHVKNIIGDSNPDNPQEVYNLEEKYKEKEKLKKISQSKIYFLFIQKLARNMLMKIKILMM